MGWGGEGSQRSFVNGKCEDWLDFIIIFVMIFFFGEIGKVDDDKTRVTVKV